MIHSVRGAIHDDIAPCRACGMHPTSPAHLVRADTDMVCAARVREVELLIDMLARGEDRTTVTEYRQRPGDRALAAYAAARYLALRADEERAA